MLYLAGLNVKKKIPKKAGGPGGLTGKFRQTFKNRGSRKKERWRLRAILEAGLTPRARRRREPRPTRCERAAHARGLPPKHREAGITESGDATHFSGPAGKLCSWCRQVRTGGAASSPRGIPNSGRVWVGGRAQALRLSVRLSRPSSGAGSPGATALSSCCKGWMIWGNLHFPAATGSPLHVSPQPWAAASPIPWHLICPP